MGGSTIDPIIIQNGGHVTFKNSPTNIINIFTIENFHEINQKLEQPLKKKQETFLKYYLQRQNATTLEGLNPHIRTALPKIETILISVPLIWWKDMRSTTKYSGTAFLAEITGNCIVFLSAVNNFQSILTPKGISNQQDFSLNNFTVKF